MPTFIKTEYLHNKTDQADLFVTGWKLAGVYWFTKRENCVVSCSFYILGVYRIVGRYCGQ